MKIAPGLTLDPDLAAGQTFGVLAKKGAGKTYTARVMAEEFTAAKVQIGVLDPTGAWWGLRSSADGKGDGLAIPIFGGDHGDAPLEPSAGKLMADLAVDEGLSMILDLSGFGTRTAERTFAAEYLERLYRRNRHLLHLFVDEADLFAPQKPQPGDQVLLGTMQNIVRRGRIKGLGVSLITQRPAVLSKDVLTQIDEMVALRLTSPQDRKAILEWVKGHGDDGQAQEVTDSLAGLQNGEAWWWAPERDVLKRVQVRESRTFDSSPTPRRGDMAREPKSFADVDILALASKIQGTVERAKANDPRELRKQVSRLESELRSRPDVVDVREKIVEIQTVPPAVKDAIRKAVVVYRDLSKDLHVWAGSMDDIAEHLAQAVEDADEPTRVERETPGRTEGRRDRARPQPTTPPRSPEKPPENQGEIQLKKGAREILALLCSMHPQTLTRKQVAAQVGIKSRGSTFSSYLSNLRIPRLVYEEGDRLGATQAGFDYLGEAPAAPPSPEEVINRWRAKLKKGARDMLEACLRSYPNGWKRDDLALELGIDARGSTFSSYLSNLRTAELIEEWDNEIFLAEALKEAANG